MLVWASREAAELCGHSASDSPHPPAHDVITQKMTWCQLVHSRKILTVRDVVRHVSHPQSHFQRSQRDFWETYFQGPNWVLSQGKN